VCVKIPLFQAIKDVCIYSKVVRENCLRKLDRKRKDLQTVHVMGKLPYLMMGRVIIDKHSDLGSPVVNVKINNTIISKILIYLGASINIMTCDTMQS
jgi:hypothetical protein